MVFKAYKHTASVAEGERGKLVCDTSDNPVAVTAGEDIESIYNSPDCTFSEAGSYYWVEQLLGGDGRLLWESEYGTALEITIVDEPLAQTGAADDRSLATQLGTLAGGTGVIGGLLLAWAIRRRRLALS